MRSYQQFFAELKRRKVFKVAAVYGAVSFGLIQVADPLAAALRLPDTFLTYVLAILLLGFPLALVLAWALEVTPDGVRKTEAAAPGEIEAIVSQPLSKRWPAGLMALAGVGALIAGAWWVGRQTAPEANDAAAATEPADVRLAFAEPGDDLRPSLAVLPFVNMSAEKEQDYFSDGITEEILSTLARIRELKVAARTSAFAFRGQNLDMRAIGDSLGVAYLIEGSVRKAGNLLRITVQLIDAADGTHMWSDQYDRPMDDVFAIQTEIAQAIASALRVPLGLDDPSALVTPTADVEAYDLYLAGRARMRERGVSLREAIQLFRAAIARDSMWAPAWAGLAESLELIGWYEEAWDEAPGDSTTFLTGRDTLWTAAEQAARRALVLDPSSASANVALGSVLRNAWRWEESERAFLKALSVDPDSPEAHQQYANMLIDMGRIAEGRRSADRAVALDRVPVRILWQAFGLETDNEQERAQEVLAEGFREYPEFDLLRDALAQTRAALGQWDEWIDMAPDDSAREQMRQFLAGDRSSPGLVSGRLEAMMVLGNPDTVAVELAQQAPFTSLSQIWSPLFDPLRDHPVYLEMLRKVNLEGAVPQRTPR